jgi:hypothetical protein
MAKHIKRGFKMFGKIKHTYAILSDEERRAMKIYLETVQPWHLQATITKLNLNAKCVRA